VRAWAGAVLGVLMAATAHGSVKATLDANQVGAGESVRLILQYEGQTHDQPDLTPLQQDFDILSTSRSNNMQIINGTVSSHTEAQVILSPKHSGQISVPQIKWAGELSNPLTLTVSGTAAAQADSVFLETIVDQKTPYVQAAVNVTVRVYSGEQLLQASLDFAGNGDVLVQQVGADRNRTMEKNGRQYEVVERHYVLFPQKSGELKLPGPQLAGQVVARVRPDRSATDPFADLFGAARGLAGGTKPIRVHGDDVVLNVRARPSSVDARYWLPAQNVTLTENWHPDAAEVHVGDPITRDLHIRAEGLTAEQLPDLAALISLPAGLKAYPDQAKFANAAQGDIVIGKRDQSVAMIADQAGTFELAPLRLTWWDTQTNQPREMTLPGRTLKILPAVGRAAVQAPDATAGAGIATGNLGAASAASAGGRSSALRDPWLWISLALALLWLGTVLAWIISRRPMRKAAPLTAPKARAQFLNACRRNDAQGARGALLAWAATAWPDSPPRSLAALSRRVGDDKIGALLLQLGRALYRGAPWDGAALASGINELPPRRGATRNRNADGEGLAPLYR
jgi:oxygen tolerance protein BatD